MDFIKRHRTLAPTLLAAAILLALMFLLFIGGLALIVAAGN